MTARNHQKVVRFSKEEREIIEKKARDLDMTPASYLRTVGLRATVQVEYYHCKK